GHQRQSRHVLPGQHLLLRRRPGPRRAWHPGERRGLPAIQLTRHAWSPPGAHVAWRGLIISVRSFPMSAILARIDAAVLGDRHARLIDFLTARIGPQGAVQDRCASRVAESALFLRLLQGEHAEPGVQDGLITYLRGAEPGDEGSQILRDAALGHPDMRRAGAFCERFEHGTGERKQLMLRTAFALFDLLPFEDLPPIRYQGQAVWTEVSLCACSILHGHAHGRRDEADQAFLTGHLASAGPARVWQGNVLAHLIALHALRTFEPGGLLTVHGIEAVAATR